MGDPVVPILGWAAYLAVVAGWAALAVRALIRPSWSRRR